jgi:hypothetical protein
VVTDNKKKRGGSKQASNSIVLIEPEKELFEKLEQDYKDMKYNFKEQVIVV